MPNVAPEKRARDDRGRRRSHGRPDDDEGPHKGVDHDDRLARRARVRPRSRQRSVRPPRRRSEVLQSWRFGGSTAVATSRPATIAIATTNIANTRLDAGQRVAIEQRRHAAKAHAAGHEQQHRRHLDDLRRAIEPARVDVAERRRARTHRRARPSASRATRCRCGCRRSRSRTRRRSSRTRARCAWTTTATPSERGASASQLRPLGQRHRCVPAGRGRARARRCSPSATPTTSSSSTITADIRRAVPGDQVARRELGHRDGERHARATGRSARRRVTSDGVDRGPERRRRPTRRTRRTRRRRARTRAPDRSSARGTARAGRARGRSRRRARRPRAPPPKNTASDAAVTPCIERRRSRGRTATAPSRISASRLTPSAGDTRCAATSSASCVDLLELAHVELAALDAHHPGLAARSARRSS